MIHGSGLVLVRGDLSVVHSGTSLKLDLSNCNELRSRVEITMKDVA